jgi:hypothetical protein
MLLVNEEDRDYNKLRSFEAITVDGMEKIPPFNATEYLENHKVDPANLIERLNDTVKRVYNREDKAGLIGRMAITVRAAQVAAYEFMLMHPTPDVEAKNAFFTKAQFNALKAIVNTPEKAFKGYMNNDIRAEMAKYEPMSAYIKNVERTGKDALKTARKEASAAEKDYGNQVDNIKNTLTGEKAEAALAELRAKEIERLEKAYCEGKLPSDYFEQRRFNVEQGKHDRKVPFGVDERPSFRQFKAENADSLKGMSSSDIKFMYNNMMDNARRAENKFMLTAAGKQPKPTIEHAEPVEVKETQHLREHLDLTHDLNENAVEVSKQIVHENPQPNITKYP